MRDAVRFFDNQFQHLSAMQLPDLNPFEQRSVPYLKRRVLDFGCCMVNLNVLAVQKGIRPCRKCQSDIRRFESVAEASKKCWVTAPKVVES